MRRLWCAFLALGLLGSIVGAAQAAYETGASPEGASGFDQWRPTLMLLAMAGSFVISLVALMRTVRRDQVKEVEDRIASVEAQMRRAEDASKKRDDEQVGEIRGVHDRVGKIEVHMKHLPDKEQVQRLEVTVARMDGDVKSVAQGLKSVSASTTRIENFLLNRNVQ
jgi:hypothetical protein